MTFTEVVCAIWALAVLGSAALLGWTQAVSAMELTASARAADDCADNAAEIWMAGQTPAPTPVVNGNTCNVQVIAPKPGEEAVMTIVAQVGRATQTLSVPEKPL